MTECVTESTPYIGLIYTVALLGGIFLAWIISNQRWR